MHLLLSESAWAIEPGYFKGLYKELTSSLPGQKPAEIKAEMALTFGKDQQTGQQTEKKVAVIGIQDAITKRSWWYAGTKNIVKMINDANADASITGIILDIDSPGGTVDGTEELAQVVRDSKKPIVAFVDGMTASAAYWIASQADFIIINSGTTSRVGSIGTLIMHVDQSGYLEQNGIKVTLITADASTDKVLGNSYEPLSDKALEMFKEHLNTINDTFIATVKSGRGKKIEKAGSEDIYTGKMYAGAKALDLGLVDKIGNMDDAVDKVIQLAAKSAATSFKATALEKGPETVHDQTTAADPSSNSQLNNNTFQMKFPKLSAFFSWNQEKAENPSVSADELAKIEAELAQKDQIISELTTAKEKAESDAAAAATKVTQLSASVDTQKTQIETLEKWKADAAAKNTKSTDELNDLNQASEKSYNTAAHNKKVGAKI